MLTKGRMITELKKAGVRQGDKDGALVGLSHLKTPKVVELYCQYCVNKEQHCDA